MAPDEPDEPTASPPNVSFPRGGAGPPQALPRGANAALVVISLVAIGATLATLAWAFGV